MPSEVSPAMRLENALWGLFIADALAMPVHWYYNLDTLKRDYPSGIKGYGAARHPHPEAFMTGRPYKPDVVSAKRLGRPFDILHEHARFYTTTYTTFAIDRSERDEETGNALPGLDERYHYHHGLKAGENTVGAHLARVLMRSVIDHGRYDPERFIEGFIEHMTTPGKNRDAYLEAYIRYWFENYSKGAAPSACAAFQRDDWSIGGHGAMPRPMILSTLAPSTYQGIGLAIEHLSLTQRSENVASALAPVIPALHRLIQGAAPRTIWLSLAESLRLPKVGGRELFEHYSRADGPYNIPKDEMWRLHTDLETAPFDVERLVRECSDDDIIGGRLSTACYPEHGLPLMIYLTLRHDFDFEATLLANANAGGDNVHRGMVLGMLMGAMVDHLPDRLKTGLLDHDDLKREIKSFADIALSGTAT